VIEASGVDQRDVTLAVPGNDLFLAAPHLFGELGEGRSNLIHRNNIVAVYGHAGFINE
jgi:hypothetical protein